MAKLIFTFLTDPMYHLVTERTTAPGGAGFTKRGIS